MCNKRKLTYSKSTILNFILIRLLEEKKVLKLEILEYGISRKTMYKYINELECNLFDLEMYHINITSNKDYYMI